MANYLFQAARDGSLSERQIVEYKKNNGNLNAKDSNGLTLLCAAVAGGSHRVVRRLLRHGASVNEPSLYNCTALWFSTRLFDKGKADYITKRLLEAGAQVNICSDAAMLRTTPLMNLLRAGHGITLMSNLLIRGASVTFPAEAGSLDSDANFFGNKLIIEELKRHKPPPPKSYFASARDVLLGYLAAVVGKFTKKATKALVDGENGGQTHSEPKKVLIIDRATFSRNLTQQIADAGLAKFYPPGHPLVETVMTKAIELAESGGSVLASPEYLPGLSKLSLFQPILFCDNSGSMNTKDRIDSMIEIVSKITKICTLLLPDDEGVAIRFLNCSFKEAELYKQYATVRSATEAETMINEAGYTGQTKLGTILKRDVLQPFVYDVLSNGSSQLKRPLLISIFTDGCPYGEETNHLAEVISECKVILRERGADSNSVKFQVTQIGDDKGAEDFLASLASNPELQGDIFITPGKIDEEFKKHEDNDDDLEIWLLKTLMGPILADSRDSISTHHESILV